MTAPATHQELFNRWVRAEASCIAERSGSIRADLETLVAFAQDYARTHGLDATVVYEVKA